MSMQLAHQGGWDEITAAVLGPLLVIAALVAAAIRRRPVDEEWDEDGDEEWDGSGDRGGEHDG